MTINCYFMIHFPEKNVRKMEKTVGEMIVKSGVCEIFFFRK